jgi:chitinase
LNAIKSNLFSGGFVPTSSSSKTTNKPTSQFVTNSQTSVSKSSDNNQKRLVCYHTNWSQYRPGTQKFFPDNIDPSLCTHIIYSFAKFTNYELAAYEWNDENMDWSKGLYQKTIDLKLKNPNLKVLLAVGGNLFDFFKFFKRKFIYTTQLGWNMGSTEFSIMVHDYNLRSKFVRTAVTFLQRNKFDGLGELEYLAKYKYIN